VPQEAPCQAGRSVNRHKFHAQPTIYEGHRYDSKSEAEYAARLDVDPDVIWWLPHVPIPLGIDAEGKQERWRVDFLVCEKGFTEYPTQHIHAVDVKGMLKKGTKVMARLNKHKRLWRIHAPFPLKIVVKGVTVEIVEPD